MWTIIPVLVLDQSGPCQRCTHPKPWTTAYRWRIHWKIAHGQCCYFPESLTQTVSSKPYSTRWCRPVRGRWPEPASGSRGGISCGSFGLSRSRRCSWGNHLRLAAKPPQTQSTLARCFPRPLWGRKHGDGGKKSIDSVATALTQDNNYVTYPLLDQKQSSYNV